MKNYLRGSSLAERLGNDTEHDNKGAEKVNRISPSGELKTSEAACTSLCQTTNGGDYYRHTTVKMLG